jgi:hypothetical protein
MIICQLAVGDHSERYQTLELVLQLSDAITVIENCSHVMRNARTYKDSGHIRSCFIEADGTERTTELISFQTHYSRPSNLVIGFSANQEITVFQSNEHATSVYNEKRILQSRHVKIESAVAAHIGHLGEFHLRTLALLSSNGLGALNWLRIAPQMSCEMSPDSSCWNVEWARHKEHRMSLWIDRLAFTVLRHSVQTSYETEKQSGAMCCTVQYTEAVLDEQIDPSIFEPFESGL